jgi:hypothetical protein
VGHLERQPARPACANASHSYIDTPTTRKGASKKVFLVKDELHLMRFSEIKCSSNHAQQPFHENGFDEITSSKVMAPKNIFIPTTTSTAGKDTSKKVCFS